MKLQNVLFVLVSFTILFCGCYTYSPISRDEELPADDDAQFQLKDGWLLESEAGNHVRVEGGYQVTGTLTKVDTVRSTSFSGIRKMEKPFTGIVRDSDVLQISAYQSSTGGALVGVGAVVAALAILLIGAFSNVPW